MRFDWVFAFLAGVLGMAGLAYLIWRSAGQPPPEQ